jgi:putative Holliday junction resolvase
MPELQHGFKIVDLRIKIDNASLTQILNQKSYIKMLLPDLSTFTETAKGRIAGLDHGGKTIGIAISDANWGLAVPVTTIRRTKFAADIEALLRVIEERGIGGLVIGYPLNMDGTEGPRCQSVRAFVRNLEDHCPLPVLLWDERLSSSEADEIMKDAGISAKNRPEKRDTAAATLILQSVLDAIEH